MVEARFTKIVPIDQPCSLGVGCAETGICYAMAHQQEDQCGMTQSVEFTLQGRDGKFFSFKHPSFDEFCAKAIALVRRPFLVVDTDQLIGHWFEF